MQDIPNELPADFENIVKTAEAMAADGTEQETVAPEEKQEFSDEKIKEYLSRQMLSEDDWVKTFIAPQMAAVSRMAGLNSLWPYVENVQNISSSRTIKDNDDRGLRLVYQALAANDKTRFLVSASSPVMIYLCAGLFLGSKIWEVTEEVAAKIEQKKSENLGKNLPKNGEV